MEVEKRGSKGGFLNFFDWNSRSRSRKKLFSSKAELDGTRQLNKHINKLGGINDVDDSGVGLVYGGGYSPIHTSSVSSDEGYGTKAPGVVARLMGLDSLPIPSSSASEPRSDFSCALALHCPQNNFENVNNHQNLEYDCVSKEFEVYSRCPPKFRPQKLPTRPIDRFQSEVLPPKSAKSVPVTHIKLLSPIKGPGFIPKKRAAYVMEAAAKFIESGSQKPIKGKNPSFGSSSAPVRIRDLRQKMEAAQKLHRPVKANESVTVKNGKVQPSYKKCNESKGTQMLEDCPNSVKINNARSRNRGRSVSLAVQAKVNVQRREDSTSCGNRRREGQSAISTRNVLVQKEHTDVHSSRIPKCQPGPKSTGEKTSRGSKSCGVLKQNNQKQNCISSTDSFPTRTSSSYQRVKKSVSVNGSPGPRKMVNKVVVNSYTGSVKVGSVRTDTGRDPSSKVSQKKQSVKEDKDSHNESSNQDVMSSGSMYEEVDSRRKGMDVVSFTFTSPIKKIMQASQPSSQEHNDCFLTVSCRDVDHPDGKNSKLSPHGSNIITSDTLSVLLDQKLRDLACKVENLNRVSETAASSSSSVQDIVSIVTVASATPSEQQRRLQPIQKGNSSDFLSDDGSSMVSLELKAEQKQQEVEIKEHWSSIDRRKAEKMFQSEYGVPVSVLELASPSDSCVSSDNRNIDNNDGTSQFSSILSEETIAWPLGKSSQPEDGDTELSDSASSIWNMSVCDAIQTLGLIENEEPIDWERGHVRDIVWRSRLCMENVWAEPQKILGPSIFEELENQKGDSHQSEPEYCKLERRVWFECVAECLNLRCQQFSGGGVKAWAKRATLFQRKDLLAEELYKEIMNWRSMEELMVDDLVDKDMSTGPGKWIDFEIESFEEGLQIEEDVLTCLVDELVDDVFT